MMTRHDEPMPIMMTVVDHAVLDFVAFANDHSGMSTDLDHIPSDRILICLPSHGS